MQAITNFFKTLVDLIGPGAVVEYPRENDGYTGTEYKYWRMVFVSRVPSPLFFSTLVPLLEALVRRLSRWRSEKLN